MNKTFIEAKHEKFILDGKTIILRGFALGTWMNLENFMIRIPGTEKRIRETFAEVYGKENSEKFFNDFMNHFITEDDFIFLKSLGINVLRIAINHRHFENDQEPGKYKETGFKHLNRVLELCKKHEIFAILDLHTSPGGQNPDQHADNQTGVPMFWEDASLRERIINLWGYISDRYKDEEIIAGYDILNEPSFVSDEDAFNDFYEKVIKKIREKDNNHILFLEGDNWSKDFGIFRNLGGHQQALSFHLYPGQHVCLHEETEKRKTELEKIILEFVKLREKTGMPLWVGETGGLFPKDKMTEGINLIKDCIDLFEKYNISWTIWTYKDAKTMGMVYPKENTKWMIMGNEFKPHWQAKERRNSTVAKEIFKMLEDKFSYTIDREAKRPLYFRIFSLLDELNIHQLVKPKLQSITWEEMREYPKSFLWENCEYWKELAELIKSYTE
ncbi:MAG: glycoside hydrolase family 5 protein [Ignavibacteria bacterium]